MEFGYGGGVLGPNEAVERGLEVEVSFYELLLQHGGLLYALLIVLDLQY